MTEKRTNHGAFTGTYSDKEHYKRAYGQMENIRTRL